MEIIWFIKMTYFLLSRFLLLRLKPTFLLSSLILPIFVKIFEGWILNFWAGSLLDEGFNKYNVDQELSFQICLKTLRSQNVHKHRLCMSFPHYDKFLKYFEVLILVSSTKLSYFKMLHLLKNAYVNALWQLGFSLVVKP